MGICSSIVAEPEKKTHKKVAMTNDVSILHKYRILEEIKDSKRPKSIYKVLNVALQQIRVLKKVNLAKDNENEAMKLIEIYRELDHPLISKLDEVFETNAQIQMIFEFSEGTDLLQYFNQKKEFDEHTFALVVFQLTNLIYYLHQKKIAVRCLDPDNIVFDGKTIKLISLKNAVRCEGQTFRQHFGNFWLMSPEMILGKYNKKNDIWQIGVIAFYIIVGYEFVEGESLAQMKMAFSEKKYDHNLLKMKDLQNDLKTVILSMLELDPEKRKALKELIKLPFFENFKKELNGPVQRKSLFNAKLEKIVFRNSFLKNLDYFLVREGMTSDEKNEGLEAFQKLDFDGDGKLSPEEIKVGLKNMHETDIDEKCHEVFKKLDPDNTGFVNYTQFLELWIDRQKFFSEEKMQKYFRMLDVNNQGFVTFSELEKILGGSVNSQDFNKMLAKYTTKKQIDEQVFIKLIRELKFGDTQTGKNESH